ncbi:hypothetical protein AMATHDRAFT_81368 [Amanita thiersii Skay4041]|uniref:Pentacotripeptide-repeat region of PRORP domain-containing protein n=1 Tax=Amanita thiersii Skay4041 TaxID=703135 RepID=A0A2A9NFA4_9AGAR|nr:hypothetical protein AMATHDRAFT_81368 [Amanita thiersii Skay4041]
MKNTIPYIVPEPVSGPIAELEKRVQALEEAAIAESSILEPPSYTEEELMAVYEDLLAVPKPEPELEPDTDNNGMQISQNEEDLAIISVIEQRLQGSFPPVDEEEASVEPMIHTPSEHSPPSYQRVLLQLENLILRLEAVQRSVTLQPESSDEGLSTPLHQFVPVNIVSAKECEALVRLCVQAGDRQSAEKVLGLMRRTGLPLPTSSVTEVLALYAKSGEVAGIEQAMANFLTGAPAEDQRHLHIKAHLKATPPDAIPTTALQVLHNYELQSLPAQMRTYTSVITSLFSRHSSVARAQAWDLFSHMRYVAHPNPDEVLYTLMIRACASPISTSRSSEPERALDLWTEMTVDKRITPTARAYGAIILACAKSGMKRYVNEAFRLAREMLDSYRDARGNPAFRPDKRTFCALLEGAKRVGDLGRARWILAEMVKGGEDGVDSRVDEEVMMHVFHAYTAYKPPFVRSIVPPAKSDSQDVAEDTADIGEDIKEHGTDASEVSADFSDSSQSNSGVLVVEEGQPTFSHIPPQSRQEVIHEVQALFRRILLDTGRVLSDNGVQHSPESFPEGRNFEDVILSPRLLNSYLSVFYKHSSLETSREMFWTLYSELGVERNARAYVEALERCSIAKQSPERQIALQFMNELWSKWEALENSKRDGEPPLDSRLIERAYAAVIRILALIGELDKSLNHIRSFVSKYPPKSLRQPFSLPPSLSIAAMRSTRTALVGARPLVRLTSPAELPDDHVPPFLMFKDVEILHHRLAASEQIGYIKWVCKAYEWALRNRRHDTIRAAPSPKESVV